MLKFINLTILGEYESLEIQDSKLDDYLHMQIYFYEQSAHVNQVKTIFIYLYFFVHLQ